MSPHPNRTKLSGYTDPSAFEVVPFLLFNFSLQFQKKAKHKQAGRGRDLVTATVAVTGLNKSLLMFPTARWKARDIRSAVAAAVCFFCAK